MRHLWIGLLATACSASPVAPAPDAARPASTLRVDPSEAALAVVVGEPSEVSLTASIAETNAPVEASFRLVAGVGLGRIERNRFVASGERAGTAVVEASAAIDGVLQSARATITVRVEELDANGVPAERRAAIDQAAATDEDPLDVVYPLAGAVMPANVAPPLIQWWGRGWGSTRPSGRGDVLRIELARPSIRIVRYQIDDDAHTHAWRPSAATWRRLVRSDPGTDVRVIVRRHRAGEPGASIAETTFRVVESETRTAIYYWDLSLGRIVRVRDGAPASEDFAPSMGCVGCHAVSPSGRYLAGAAGSVQAVRIFDATSPEIGGTASPPALSDPPAWEERHWGNAFTWFPDEERLVYSYDGKLTLIDRASGEPIPTDPGGAPIGGDLTYQQHPNISHDGRRLLFVQAQYAYHYDFGRSSIMTQSIEGTRFGPPSIVVDGAAPHETDVTGCMEPTTIGRPNFSPDDRWVAYTRGCGNSTYAEADAFIVSAGGTGTPIPLRRAVADANVSHLRFSPDADADRAWVAFIARRPYGNPLAGYGNRSLRQIWYSAIDLRALERGEDPSAPAYRVEGPAYSNMGSPPFPDRPSVAPYDAIVLELDYARVCACVIDGVCRAPGEPNPLNSCESCNSAAPDRWSPVDVGAACDDGSACTSADACTAAGRCEGSPIDCEDGLACTTDRCEPADGSCEHEVVGGCLIDGRCESEGALRDGDPCRACIPSRAVDAWSEPRSCGGLTGGGAG